jgi:hypothetical protein
MPSYMNGLQAQPGDLVYGTPSGYEEPIVGTVLIVRDNVNVLDLTVAFAECVKTEIDMDELAEIVELPHVVTRPVGGYQRYEGADYETFVVRPNSAYCSAADFALIQRRRS